MSYTNPSGSATYTQTAALNGATIADDQYVVDPYTKELTASANVSNTVIETEAAKVGLTVTDEELQNVLKAGTNPLLMQTPFVNQQTGRFDATQLTKFLADYKKLQSQGGQQMEQYDRIYKYWKFMEKMLRQNILSSKYQGLLHNSIWLPNNSVRNPAIAAPRLLWLSTGVARSTSPRRLSPSLRIEEHKQEQERLQPNCR